MPPALPPPPEFTRNPLRAQHLAAPRVTIAIVSIKKTEPRRLNDARHTRTTGLATTE